MGHGNELKRPESWSLSFFLLWPRAQEAIWGRIPMGGLFAKATCFLIASALFHSNEIRLKFVHFFFLSFSSCTFHMLPPHTQVRSRDMIAELPLAQRQRPRSHVRPASSPLVQYVSRRAPCNPASPKHFVRTLAPRERHEAYRRPAFPSPSPLHKKKKKSLQLRRGCNAAPSAPCHLSDGADQLNGRRIAACMHRQTAVWRWAVRGRPV